MPTWRDYSAIADDNQGPAPTGAPEGGYQGRWVNDTFRYMMAVIRDLGDKTPKLADGGDPEAKVGGMAYQDPANVAITGGSIAGVGGVMPLRGIVAFGGSVAQAQALEPQWALCDGRTVNGITTPNLRGRFVRGWSDSLAPDTTGGSTDDQTTTSAGAHTHSGTTGSTTLTTNQIPSHSHREGSSSDDTTGTTSAIQNDAGLGINRAGSIGNPNDSWRWLTEETGGGAGHTHTIGSDGAHTHTVNAPPPPYYVLVYIMRTA